MSSFGCDEVTGGRGESRPGESAYISCECAVRSNQSTGEAYSRRMPKALSIMMRLNNGIQRAETMLKDRHHKSSSMTRLEISITSHR
jgi:hypothetical protein